MSEDAPQRHGLRGAAYLNAFTGSAARFLHRPFERNGWTYASDASIAIRIPMIAGTEFPASAPEIEKLPWPNGDETGWGQLPPLPPRKMTTCPECAEMATGKPSRDCLECGGRGTVAESQRVRIGGAEFCSEYLRKMKLFLPRPEIIAPQVGGLLRVRFYADATDPLNELRGYGLLMPLRPLPSE